MRDRDLTARYEERFEVEDSEEWTVAMAEYNREAGRDVLKWTTGVATACSRD